MDLRKDDIKKLFMKFLVPAVSSAIAVAAYSLVDTIAIGQGCGADGAASCAVVLPIFSIANFIGLLCGIGGSVLRSQARGQGNEEKGNAIFTTSTVLVSVITLVVWVLGFVFQKEFYRVCGADEVLMPLAVEYGTWIFAAMPTFILTSFLGAFIRTDGSPRFVMCSTLIGGAINMIGDWLFVFPLDMGMTGAALATVLSSVTQASLLLVYILRKKTTLKLVKPYRWSSGVKKISMVGFGAGISQLSTIALSVIANNQIMKYCGAPSLAVYGVLGTVTSVFMSIFAGVGQAAQPIVSENYGAGNHGRCWKAEGLGMKTTIIFGFLFSVVCIVFPLGITSVFMKMTEEVAEVAPYILRVYALSFIPLAVNTFAIYFLQAIDRSKMATVISLLRGLIINGIFLYVFPLIVGGNGIWWAIFLAEMITTLLSVIYLMMQYGGYKRHENAKG